VHLSEPGLGSTELMYGSVYMRFAIEREELATPHHL
jgi:hypothetical protein